jgi:SAM-dependent methyltransferase
MQIPYPLMYRLGFAPWERRPVTWTWQRMTDGPAVLPPGRALDVGCGTGRDAVYLAKRGWRVTAVDIAGNAIAKARQRAADEGVDVQWVVGDVSALGGLGLDPGYTLVYDFGCLQGLPDSARAGAAAGMTKLAAPGAALVLSAFAPSRRVLFPRGMGEEEISGCFGAGWELIEVEPVTDPAAPPPVRQARLALYRLTRKKGAEAPGS